MPDVRRIEVVIKGCPLYGKTTLSQCLKCPHCFYVKGVRDLKPTVCCVYRGKDKPLELKAELVVSCPKRRGTVRFKDCLKCDYHRGFYGFHCNNPVVFCEHGRVTSRFIEAVVRGLV